MNKIKTLKFCSDAKRTKLKAFRTQQDAAANTTVGDDDFFDFLRHFHLLGYDLDIHSGLMHAVLYSLIGRFSQENAASLWTRIVQEVISANQNTGTITCELLPDDLKCAFAKREAQTIPETLTRALAPREAHRWQNSEFATALVVANLLGAWNENSAADMTVAKRLAGEQPETWLSSIREVLQLPDSPLRLQNGVWSVKNREEFWDALGSRVFDDHLNNLKVCAELVLRERDPQFDLKNDERFSAAIYGKLPEHSSHIRKGLAETLALLGSRAEQLVNCSQDKPEITAALVVRGIFDSADWVNWGSVNDVLPLLAEAAPGEFLTAVELAVAATPCPFDELFAQEGGVGLGGRNYLTGLWWALETLAWDDEFLVRAAVALGTLAERDPGWQWTNRPSNSLTTIFLPWLPQTVASVEKRKVAIKALSRESPIAAWELLLSLLPTHHGVSTGAHEPLWRRTIPTDWKDRPTQEEFWQQVSGYADLAVDVAISDLTRLVQLIGHLDHLPKPASTRILNHLASDEIKDASEEVILEIWKSLTVLARKHRRFADAEWALSSDFVSQIESTAAAIAPQKPQDLYCELFSGRDWDLYEEKGNWREQERKLEARRQEAIRKVLRIGGIEAVHAFAEVVESPVQVGFSLASLGDQDIDSQVLPDLLGAEDEKHKQFATGFVCGNYRHQGWLWVDSIGSESWLKEQIRQLLTCLPFTTETWERAERLLGDEAAEYWKKAVVNPYQADGDLYTAVDKLIEHNRPRAGNKGASSVAYI